MSEASDAGGDGLPAAERSQHKLGKADAATARRERQAAQLRANLARRKQQAREKARLSAAMEGSGTTAENADRADTSGQ